MNNLELKEINQDQLPQMKWLAKAISDSEHRYVLNFFHVEGDKIVSTDGKKRLHCMTEHDHGLDDGEYRVVTNSGKQMMVAKVKLGDLKFPAWRQIVFSDENRVCENLSKNDVNSNTISSFVSMQTGFFFDNSHLVDAFGFGTIYKNCTKKNKNDVRLNHVEVFTDADRTAIKVVDDNRLAIIMGMRVNG